jgi:hypothetical protein
MGSLDGRLGALEARVEERVEEEIDAVLDRLQKRLSPEEYRRVLEIIASGTEEERWGA